LKLLLKIKF